MTNAILRKKQVGKISRQRALLMACASLVSMICSAAVIPYNTGSGIRDLSQDAAWIGGIQPKSGDVALLSGVGGEFTLANPAEWQGLVISNLTSGVKLSGKTLTLGSAGIRPGGSVPARGTLALYVPIVLSCDQEWYARDGYNGIVVVYGGVSGPGRLTTRGFQDDTTGIYGIRSSIETSWNAHGPTHRMQDSDTTNASVAGDVDLDKGHEIVVLNADMGGTGVKSFRDIFKSGCIVNDGRIQFGEDAVRGDVLFAEGDRIVGNETLTAGGEADRADLNHGVVTEHKGRFKMTGGGITNNFFYLHGGDFEQTGGNIWLRYRLSGVGGNLATGQRFAVNGVEASVDADRIILGIGNSEVMQNWMIVSNGTVCARTRVEMASAAAGGANTRLEVANGKVSTGGLWFGDIEAAANTNAFAKVEVKGGEFAVGSGGVQVNADSWNGDTVDSMFGSWYRFLVSGGHYRAFASHENSAAIVLDGGGIKVDEGVVMTQSGALSGAAALTKTGTGTLALPAVCAWTGSTVVAEGTLLARGTARPKDPYLSFRADALNLEDGAVVENWAAEASDGIHTNAFTKTVATAVGITKLPKFLQNRFSGHAAVSFNGTNEGLAMTSGTDGASNYGPINDATNFTVAVVFRATSGVGNSGEGNSAFFAAGILGQYYGAQNSRWTFAMAEDGVLAGGTALPSLGCSLWAESDSVIDEKPHVAFFNWTSGGNIRINADGKWTEREDSVNATKISKNRMLLGAAEGFNGGELKFFGGEIAEVRIYRNDLLTKEEIDAIGLDLALTYGADYIPASTSKSLLAVSVATEVPEATGVWCADDLKQDVGQPVEIWKDSINDGEFNTTVGKAILSETKAPKLSSTKLNGHKAVRFDGDKNMLGLTGGKGSTYIGSEGKNFTVALVLKAENVSNGLRGGFPASVGVLGQAFSGDNSQNKWGIGVVGDATAGAEQMVMGVKDGLTPSVDVHGKVRYMCDGYAHVVICAFGTDMTINVDGVRATHAGATTKARQGSARTTLGRIEPIGKESGSDKYYSTYFKGDIAEIRFFADKKLTVAEQNALGRELAVKYGIDAGGFYETGESAFLSKRITVAAGARLMGAGEGFRVADGTAVDGQGQIAGRFVLGSGGVLDTACDLPEFADGSVAEFESGAIVRIGANTAGVPVPLEICRGIWPVDGGVNVDVTALGLIPRGIVLSWADGEAPDVSKWTITGGDAVNTHLVVDAARKCVKVKTVTGLIMVVE